MNQILTDASVLIQSLGWTLLHSLWQGAVIAAGLWLVLKTIPTARSAIKYHLSLAALTLLAVWVGSTWLQQWQLMQAVQVHITESAAYTAPARTYVITTLPQATGTWQWLQPVLPALERSFPWLVGCYLAGLVLMSLRLVTGLLHLYRIRRTGLALPGFACLRLLEALKDRLEIGGRVQLFLSSRVQVPMVMGILKPVILLPAAALAQLSPDQLEAILLHELAHIRRNDYLINLLQTLVETLLFFNPFVWHLSAVIRREREHCCDDLVLDHAPEPLPYATALAALEWGRLAAPAGALAASGQPRYLLHRIKRIMEMKNNPANYSRMIAAFLVVTAITCSVIWLTPSFGQSKNKTTEDAAPKKERQARAAAQPAYREDEPAPPVPPTPPTPVTAAATARQAFRLADSSLDLADAVLKNLDLEEIGRNVDAALQNIDWKEIEKAQRKGMKEARKAMQDAQRTMQGEDWKELSPAEQREVERALQQASQALKELDMEKIGQQVATAMKDVDWTKMSADIRKSVEEAQQELNDPQTRKRIRKETYEAVEAAREAREDALANAAELRRQAREREEEARARTEQLRQEAREREDDARANREQLEADAADRRQEARERAEDGQAAVERRRHENVIIAGNGRALDYRKLLNRMEADGLIDQDKAFAIAYSNGKLKINNKEQPESVVRKYEPLLNGRKIAIAGSRNNLAVQVE